MPVLSSIITALVAGLCLVAAFWRYWMRAYLEQKGKDFATKGDIRTVVEQVKQVTIIAEGIKNEIAHQYWNQQRQWELKKESIVRVAMAMGRLNNSISNFDIYLKTHGISKDAHEWSRENQICRDEWTSAVNEFECSRVVAQFVCGQEVNVALEEYFNAANCVGANFMSNHHLEGQMKFADMSTRANRVRDLMRREIGMASATVIN